MGHDKVKIRKQLFKPESYSEPRQTWPCQTLPNPASDSPLSKNSQRLKPLANFVKSSILDVCLGSEYASS